MEFKERARLGPQLTTPDLLRAFALHFAEAPNGQPIEEVGFGRLLERYDERWNCQANEATVLYRDTIERDQVISLPFPLVGDVVAGRTVDLRWTLVFTAPIDPTDAVDYTQAGLAVAFRPHARRFSFRDPATNKSVELDIQEERQEALDRLGNGAILGALATFYVLNHISAGLGWRLAFLLGPVLALVIIYVRKNLPESPRWQIMHGREAAAEASIAEIEADVAATKGELPPVDESMAIEITPTKQIGYLALLRVLFAQYPSRSVLVAGLMITQSFLYNAIFFTYGLVLEIYFHVKATDTALYFIAFAVGNLAGPLTIGRLFDTIGRRKMISGTYLVSGVLLIISAQLFKAGDLNATTQTLAWTVIFFFASAGASAGYLTASEVFPLEVRAKAIAVFFAIAQCFGSLGSHLYGHLIGTGNDPNNLYVGYLIGAGAMIVGGLVAVFLAVDAEGKSLEDVAKPLSVLPSAGN